MRVITNELRIKQGRRVGTVLFFVSIFVLTAGLILSNFIAVNETVILFVPCLVMPVGLVTTLLSVRLTNEWVRQPRPEEAIAEGLAGINRRSVLFNYFPPANHILITPEGIYTLTTRFQMTRFKITGDHWLDYKRRGPLAPFFQFMKQEGIGKPFEDAATDAANVQTVIDSVLPDSGIEVQPIVVFTHPRAILELEAPSIPVVFASPKKKPSIKTALREVKRERRKTDFELLSEDELNTIEKALIALLDAKAFDEATEEERD